MLLCLGLAACQAPDNNQPPVADAGDDQLTYVHRIFATDGSPVDVFDPVALDGSGSIDEDGTVTRYFWSFDTVPVGSGLELADLEPNGTIDPTTRFTPDVEGLYAFTLQVFDGQKLSSVDYVQIEVARQNGTPQARAGDDLNGVIGSAVTCDGSSSVDPDGDYLSFRWSLVMAPPASSLTSADVIYPATPNPRLEPDVEGIYTLALVVYDGHAESAPDFTTLTVTTGNQSPVVEVGESLIITPCQSLPVTLDGSSSVDPENNPFTWQWSVLEVPYGSLLTGDDLTAPTEPVTQTPLDLYGLYVFALTLDDGLSAPSTGAVAVLYDNGSTQVPPEADAGGNQTIRGQTVCDGGGCPPCALITTLDGRESIDPNGDPLGYAWSVVSGEASVEDPAAAVTGLVGPPLAPSTAGVSLSSSVKVQLEVSDCASTSAPSSVTLTFICDGVSP